MTPTRDDNGTGTRTIRLPRALWSTLERFAADELPGASIDDVVRLFLGELAHSDVHRSLVRRLYYDELKARDTR